MLLTKSYQTIVALFLSIIIISCSSSTEPELKESDQYFHIGDISQYYYQISKDYGQDEIVGKTQRSDGLEVYILEHKLQTIDSIYTSPTYVFFRDGYYYTTILEKTTDPKYKDVNPYLEFRNNKVDLKEGDNWLAFEGASDSVKIIYSVDYIGEYETLAGVFENVYSVNGYIKSLKDSVSIYVSNEYGILGTKSNLERTQVVYIKKQNREFGNKINF